MRYRILSKKEVYLLLESHGESYLMLRVNFDAWNGISEPGIKVDKKQVLDVVDETNAIIFSGDENIMQLNLYSQHQPDIHNIRREGVMHIILFC